MGIVRNSGIIVFGLVIGNILAFAFHLIVGRMLGPVEYGVFGALISLYTIIALPAGAISSAITKFTSKLYSDKDYIGIGILRKEISKRAWIVSIIIFLIIAGLSVFIADYLKINSFIPVVIVGVNLIFAMVLPVNRGILQGLRKYGHFSVNVIIEAVSRLGLVFVLLFFGLGVDGAILAYGLGYLAAFIAVFPFIRETKTKETGKVNMKRIYKYMGLVLVANFIIQAVINLPTLIVKHFYSSEFTGYFSAALTIARVTLIITSGISMVMFTEVAGLNDEKERKKHLKKAFIMTLLVSIGITIIAALIPKLIIGILYGKDFYAAGPILVWLETAMIGLSLIQLWVNYWLAKKKFE